MNPPSIHYVGRATAGGSASQAPTENRALDIHLEAPPDTDYPGHAARPEQLFAVGYCACFLYSLRQAADESALSLPCAATVTCEVGLGDTENGPEIHARLHIKAPGIPSATVRRLVERAHDLCPYSNAVRGNVDVLIAQD